MSVSPANPFPMRPGLRWRNMSPSRDSRWNSSSPWAIGLCFPYSFEVCVFRSPRALRCGLPTAWRHRRRRGWVRLGRRLHECANAATPGRVGSRADIVVIGAGATGLPAAIVAREAGASVILVEAEGDIGGHAIISGGNIPLGGGTSVQKKYGIEDSPDLLFRDLTDWSVVGPNGFPDYRYNDREIIRAFADNSAATFEWLVAHGVVFVDKAPDALGGNSVGNSVPREMHSAVMDWPMVHTGEPADPPTQRTRSSGNGLMRSLEIAAKKARVEILLEHRMTSIHRQSSSFGPVLGISVDNKGARLDIRARKAVVIGTGGSTGNVNFRRMFDPRLTEEYCGLAGMPWSDQDASGELAAMAIGASLWGFYNQIGEFGSNVTKPGSIGCQYNYRHLQWMPGSPAFDRARATGLRVAN